MEAFDVVQPGFLTTVQDGGRYGYQQYGVPVSGAMDRYAFMAANLLVGNGDDDACLEISLLGPLLRVISDTVVSLTGADLSATLNNRPLPMWEAVHVSAGDSISFGEPRRGCRSYLAVAGGIDVPPVMGSRSTYVKSGIGGFQGRALRSGDRLSSGQARRKTPGARMPMQYVPRYQSDHTLRVVLGPQDDHFTTTGIETFLGSEYRVSARADRMGYRLEGPTIEHRAGADIVSDGIPAGAVQVPADGLPIVLLADRQTTGGYAKIATVCTVDLPELSQACLGERVRFSRVTEKEAHQLLKEHDEAIRSLKHCFRRAHQGD